MTNLPVRQSGSLSPIEHGLYTVKQVAEMTPYSEKAIRRRIERGTLHVHQDREWGRILISKNDLDAAGMLAIPRTNEERAIRNLVIFLVTHPEGVYTTFKLREEAAFAVRFAVNEPQEDPNTGKILSSRVGRPGYKPLTRQTAETALSTLHVLGWVEKTSIPSGSGSGRPRTGWRWVGPPQDAAALKPL